MARQRQGHISSSSLEGTSPRSSNTSRFPAIFLERDIAGIIDRSDEDLTGLFSNQEGHQALGVSRSVLRVNNQPGRFRRILSGFHHRLLYRLDGRLGCCVLDCGSPSPHLEQTPDDLFGFPCGDRPLAQFTRTDPKSGPYWA